MKKTFIFKKIDFYRRGKKINAVEVEVELKDGGVFTASGKIWNMHKTDIVCGGQCLDEIKDFFKFNKVFKKIYRFWKLYHLNDMHSGTEKQENALIDKFGGINANNYKQECEYLKSINLYIDNGYKYGSKWLKREIPAEDLKEINDLLTI